jgi:uncharacterized protein YecE (DUF72 family)
MLQQATLFDAPAAPATPAKTTPGIVPAAVPSAEVQALAKRLHDAYGGRLHLGTSSWFFPGWQGLVWANKETPAVLSKHGLRAYAQHPLLSSVSLDRSFYRPLDASTYAQLAAQVPEHFRFVVKAASSVTDASLRDPSTGAVLGDNPLFLDAQAALSLCVQPAVQGLGQKLPRRWLRGSSALLAKLQTLFAIVVPALPAGARAALELRDAELLTPELSTLLKRYGAGYCLSLHDRMPSAAEQLPLLRAMWPGDLVCRWNLHKGLRYAQARDTWSPFDRLQAPDEPTRDTLARVVHATLLAGHRAFITINNKAEGSGILSVMALAQALGVLLPTHGDADDAHDHADADAQAQTKSPAVEGGA